MPRSPRSFAGLKGVLGLENDEEKFATFKKYLVTEAKKHLDVHCLGKHQYETIRIIQNKVQTEFPEFFHGRKTVPRLKLIRSVICKIHESNRRIRTVIPKKPKSMPARTKIRDGDATEDEENLSTLADDGLSSYSYEPSVVETEMDNNEDQDSNKGCAHRSWSGLQHLLKLDNDKDKFLSIKIYIIKLQNANLDISLTPTIQEESINKIQAKVQNRFPEIFKQQKEARLDGLRTMIMTYHNGKRSQARSRLKSGKKLKDLNNRSSEGSNAPPPSLVMGPGTANLESSAMSPKAATLSSHHQPLFSQSKKNIGKENRHEPNSMNTFTSTPHGHIPQQRSSTRFSTGLDSSPFGLMTQFSAKELDVYVFLRNCSPPMDHLYDCFKTVLKILNFEHLHGISNWKKAERREFFGENGLSLLEITTLEREFLQLSGAP